ncbi:MAG: nuclear transport factor 2 family protein [Oscillospiraceae bacterium]|nr:nuclear transport factor 2 family protein [Oscillospiraceae bacterium]
MEEQEKRLEDLLLRLERVEDYNAISSLMSAFSQYYAAFDGARIISLFADRPDTKAEMTWGLYKGMNGVKRCFSFQNPLFTDRYGQEGELHLRPLGTPVIIVAEDRQTACGAWICTGTDTQKQDSTGDAIDAYWTWNHYGVNFVRQEDDWKIWRLHEYNVCKSPFDRQWTQEPPYDPYKLCGTTQANYFAGESPQLPDEPPSSTFRYSVVELFPMNRPRVPVPYKTFDLSMAY